MDFNDSSPKTIPVFSTFSTPFDINSPPSKKAIALWPGMYHSPVTTALWEARSKIFERLLNPPKDAPPQSELLAKTPSQSRTTILYSYSSDNILREQYRNLGMRSRLGSYWRTLILWRAPSLLRLLPAFFINLLQSLDFYELLMLKAYRRIVGCFKKFDVYNWLLDIGLTLFFFMLSYASVLLVGGKIKYLGIAAWVVDFVLVAIAEGSDASDSVAVTANFIFVARDSKTGKAASVNRLSPETEHEKLLFEEAESRNKLRKKKRVDKRKEIGNGHVSRLQALLAEGRILCDMPALADRDSILLRDTCLENSLICQPQQRNIHGRIFGGFLMLRAFELAFSTAYAFAGLVPYFLEVDHVDFLRPVDVGNFLRFNSCVLYTEVQNPERPLINVEVVAHVTRPELRTSEVSNTFYFTFTVRREAKAAKDGFRIRKVVPATEEQAHRILERMDADSLQSS